MVTVVWMDRRGAGKLKSFSDSGKLESFLKILRRPAKVRNGSGEVVGEVWRRYKDDRPGRWGWYFDPDQVCDE